MCHALWTLHFYKYLTCFPPTPSRSPMELILPLPHFTDEELRFREGRASQLAKEQRWGEEQRVRHRSSLAWWVQGGGM